MNGRHSGLPAAASTHDQGKVALGGILLMCLAILLFNLLNASGKQLSAAHAIVQIVWARYVGSLLFMLVVFLPSHRMALVRPRRPLMQVVRGSMNLASALMFFSGVAVLPLSTAAAITFTGPLIITALSVPFLGEPVGIRRWAAVLVGFTGALVVIRPGFTETDWHVLFLVGSTIASAFYQLLSRRLAGEDNAATSATVTTLVGTAAMTLVVPFVWTWPTGMLDVVLFLLIGVFGGAGHYFLTVAYQRAPAAVIAPFNYTHLLWATAIGYLAFGDFPDVWTFAGAGVIIVAGLYVAHRERKVARGTAE